MTNKVFPARFGDYLLLERISTGGMAEVCLAKSFGVEGFQKTVAIKTILPHISEDESFVSMFIDEAKIAARLQHSNICQVFDFGNIRDDFGEHFYQVMEYIPGLSVKQVSRAFWDKNEQVPVGAVLHIVARVCEGLDYAHNMTDREGRPLGIVHRDVTPANVLVSIEGAVKLIDFGIAKAAQRATKTQAGIVKGKFGYMTPEQLKGLELDGRSDIFSLGVGMWELLAGRILFNEPNELDNLRKIINGDYPDIRDVRNDLPDAISRVVMKSLAHDRDLRYQSAEEFAQEINQAAFKTKNFWNTATLARFLRENFPKETNDEQIKRSKYADICKEDFLSYPSLTELGMAEVEDAVELDAGDLLMDEDSEEPEDRTVVSRIPQKEPVIKGTRSNSATPEVQHRDVQNQGFSGSLDLDVKKRRQQNEESFNARASGQFEPPPVKSVEPGASGRFERQPSGNQPSMEDSQAYPAYVSPYGELSAQNNSFIQEPSVSPDDSILDETQHYRPQDKTSQPREQGYYGEDGQWYAYPESPQAPQGYYGEDGQWYPYPESTQAPQGYYGEDGQWYAYPESQQVPQGYYGEDGQWYPYNQAPQGYYGEDGQWYPYNQAPQGYYGEDGQWYPYGNQPQGYYGEDGQWHPYPNPYYQSTHSYPDYSYPDHSRPDLPVANPPNPPKEKK